MKYKYIRQSGAAFLATMFLSIYVLKGLHHHENLIGCKASENTEIVSCKTSEATKCAICDFQMSQDLSVAEYRNEKRTGDLVIAAYPFFLSAVYSSTEQFLEGRGPPGDYVL